MSIKRFQSNQWLRSARFALLLVCSVLLAVGFLEPASAQESLSTPGDHDVEITVGTLKRQFILHVPVGYNGNAAVPLVVMMHGHGGTAKGISKAGWSVEADSSTFLVVYPQALGSHPDQPIGRRNASAWNDGSGREGIPQVDDIGFLRALLSKIATDLKVDKQRIYLAGFSNGGSMTFNAGGAMSDQIAAIGVTAGAFAKRDDTTLKLAHPLPLLFIVGTADKLNPFNGGPARDAITGEMKDRPPVQVNIDAWLKLNQCTATAMTILDKNGVKGVAYTCAPNFELDYYMIEGMQHIWPIGPNAGAGVVSADESGDLATAEAAPSGNGLLPFRKISGAKTMWAFFAKFTLSGAAAK